MRNSPLRRNLLTLVSVVSLASMTALLSAGAVRADDKATDMDHLHNSGQVMKEIVDVPDNIPQKLLDKSACVVVIPSVLKAAFVFGAMYGRGAMTCRTGEDFNGPWGAPTMMALEGGSFGLQIGAQATDFVLLVMNTRGANAILASKVKLGGDASVAAGPWDAMRRPITDASMRAEECSRIRALAGFLREFRSKGPLCARTTTLTAASMEKN